MKVISSKNGEITAYNNAFSIYYSESRPDYFVIKFNTFQQEFFIPAGCDSFSKKDLLIERNGFLYSDERNKIKFQFEYRSVLWKKFYHLDIYPDHAEFYYDLYGNHRIDTLRFFEGIYYDGHKEHIALTKHFNDKKDTLYREYSKASKINFKRVFNPEPNVYCKQEFSSFEYSQISANCDLDYCGGNFVFNPGLLCFLISECPAKEWISLGLAVRPGEYLFSEYEYIGGEGFGLNLNYWGAFRANAVFQSPKIIISRSASKIMALEQYIDILQEKSLVSIDEKEIEEWWRGPIIDGWGHQSYKSDLFRVRSPSDRPSDLSTYFMCTQANYQEFIRAIDKQDLPWKILIIDGRWSIESGLKKVDVGLWPDMRKFVDTLHARGKKVLIWWGLWETRGLDKSECILYSRVAEGNHRNRDGRFKKFNVVDGKKLTPDPTLKSFQEKIIKQVEILFGEGVGCYNLDGIKIDHVAATPGLYGMKFPSKSLKIYGIELLKYYLEFLYDSIKRVKTEALVIGQSPNPYFSNCIDMQRLGDIYPVSDAIIDQMKFRSQMVSIANPYWLIDTDNWPMPSLIAFRKYMKTQIKLGVPSLYYATHIDTTNERITEEIFDEIKQAWDKYCNSFS